MISGVTAPAKQTLTTKETFGNKIAGLELVDQFKSIKHFHRLGMGSKRRKTKNTKC